MPVYHCVMTCEGSDFGEQDILAYDAEEAAWKAVEREETDCGEFQCASDGYAIRVEVTSTKTGEVKEFSVNGEYKRVYWATEVAP